MAANGETQISERLFTGTDLRKLIFPLIIEQVLAVSVGMIDTVMISSLGESSVSGVSLVDMINVLIIYLLSALATGGAVVASQFMGAKREKDACKSAVQLLAVMLLFSGFIMGFSLILNRRILRLFFGAIEPEVMTAAVTYFRISAISYPFIGLYNCCAALFRSMGNSRVSMLVSGGANLLNVAGNALLIYVFPYGVAGAAISTAFSRFVSMAVMLVMLANKKHPIHISFRERFRFNGGIVRKILYVGIPNSLENSLFQLGRLIVVSIIAGFGTVQIAANAVANNIDGLGCIPGQALNLAMITVVGQCVGAGDYTQARFYTRKLMKITYLITAVWDSLIMLSLPLTLRLYNLSKEATELAAVLIIIHQAFAILLWPTSFTLPNTLRAANDVKYSMIISIFSMWTFRIVFSYILGKQFQMGAIGVWIAMVLDWLFRAICFLLRYRGHKWEKHKI